MYPTDRTETNVVVVLRAIPTGEPLTNSSDAPILGFILLSYESGQPLNPVLLEGQFLGMSTWREESDGLSAADYRLASGFPISQKLVNIIVPEVPTRKDYMIFSAYRNHMVAGLLPLIMLCTSRTQ